MALKEDEKHEKIIRGLLKVPGNRKCINCGSLGPQYVCISFSTFICTLCSGIHREFLHRIKSVSMSKFTVTEVADLQSGGNDRAREIFLKEWNSSRNSLPDINSPDKIREFIKLVYVQRRFTGEKSVQDTENRTSYSRQQRVEERPRAFVGQTRPNHADVGYGNRSFVRNVTGQGRYQNGDSDVEDREQNKEPESIQTTASGSKRETVIRQFLQPPVEKRKGIQLQRNYSSGNFSAPEASLPVQRSTSLKDLMSPGSETKIRNGQQQDPETTNRAADQKNSGAKVQKAPVVARSLSLIDLISGPEEPKPDTPSSTSTGNSSTLSVTRSSSMSLIDLISGPEAETSNQADPFITTLAPAGFAGNGAAELASSNWYPEQAVAQESVQSTTQQFMTQVSVPPVYQQAGGSLQFPPSGGFVQSTQQFMSQVFLQVHPVAPPVHQAPGFMQFPGSSPFMYPMFQPGASASAYHPQQSNPFDLTPLSNDLFTTAAAQPAPSYHNSYGTWSDPTTIKQSASYPSHVNYNYNSGEIMQNSVPGLTADQTNNQIAYEAPPLGRNPFA